MKKKSRPSAPAEQSKGKIVLKIVYFLLRASVILVMVAQFFNRDFQNVFLCLLTLVLFLLPSLFERRFHIDVPDTLEVIILLFIYAAEIMGEIRAYYIAFPYWDAMLHTTNGFLCAAIGFSLVDLLNRDKHFTLALSPAFMGVLAFSFSMTIGAVWEIFEYAMDRLFLLDMQKDTILHTISSVTLDPTATNRTVLLEGITDAAVVYADGSEQLLGLGGYLDVGLYDTMNDLIVNFIGAVVFSVIGYFYVKSRGKGNLVRRFVLRKMTPDEVAHRTAQDAARRGRKKDRRP